MISPQLTIALAHAKVDDFRRAAEARCPTHRGAPLVRPVAAETSVTLRFGSPGDEGLLARLAAFESAEPPAQPVLVAEIEGQPVAALSLSDGTVVADPFHPTHDLIDLLRARARQLEGDSGRRRPVRLRSLSRLRAPASG